MTNSIATSKCPSALLTSGNYGMSQNRYTDESKEYIFVKLTDSAYRAIEEYQHNENNKRFTNGQRPKIQVNGNSGVIYFPTIDNNHNNNNGNEGRKFGFTIDDVEGSLECIQQTKEGLDVLGSLPYRMRIHANDDIYDTTRTKMAIAEETEKSKCIREIKPNQTDIGRKVKKSIPLSATAAASTLYQPQQQQQHMVGHASGYNDSNNKYNHNNNHSSSNSNYLSSSSSLSRSKLVSPPTATSASSNSSKIGSGAGGVTSLSSYSTSSSRSPNPTLLGGSGTVMGGSGGASNRYGGNGSNIYSQSNVSPTLPTLTSASSLSSTLASGIANGYASAAQHNSPTDTAPSSALGGGGNSKQSRLNSNAAAGGNLSRGSGSKASGSGGTKGGSSNGNGGGGGNGKLPDISRRKIRERLIHLLALRPFKKPELYSRLQNEGLRDRERSLISNVLKDIATLSRDNTYNLRRQLWNDVNENWPYYTEQELQQLKRRKPQNLTPPLSSDAGSSTSGQSPTSTHTGSPPPMTAGVGIGNLKRASLEYDDTFVSAIQPKKQRISHFKKDAIAAAANNAVNAAAAAGASTIGGGGSGTRLANYSSSSNGSTLPRGKHSASVSYSSPQGARNLGHTDENSGNSDLSYNVLNNMDDFMLNIEQQQSSSYLPTHGGNGSSGNGGTTSSGARKSSGNSRSSASGSNPKENRHAGSNSMPSSISPKSSNSYSVTEHEIGSGNSSSSSNIKHTMKRNTLVAGSPKTTLPYGVNFVPAESSSNGRLSGGRDSNGSSNRNGSGINRNQSPNIVQQQQLKSSNSVIYSPKLHAGAAANIECDEHATASTTTAAGRGNSSSTRSQAPTSRATSKQQSRTGIGGRGIRTPTPPSQEHQQLSQQRHLQEAASTSSSSSHYQTQQMHSARAQSPVQRHPQYPYKQQHAPTQQQQYNHEYQQQHNNADNAATQLNAEVVASTQNAATTNYAAADVVETTPPPSYDFSNYKAITTIEQRRQYKTEFERDYDEYRQLLERIENVRRNFQMLADQLQRAPQGCADYEYIKQQIVAEYERINSDEAKADKQRFDYLHAKLAHIKQLVTDYDKTLTSMAAAAQAAAAAAAQAQQQQQQYGHEQQKHQKLQLQEQQLQQQQQQQKQYAATTAAMHMAAAETSHQIDSSNVLSTANAHNARVSPMVSGSESNQSPPSRYHQTPQYYVQQQQHEQHDEQHYNETRLVHSKKKKQQLNTKHQQQQDQFLLSHNQGQASTSSPTDQHHQQKQQQVIPSAHSYLIDEKHIMMNQQQQQHDNNNNNRNNDSDTDSEDSSDSNDDDDDDDDDDSNDDGDDNSNDEDDDDKGNNAGSDSNTNDDDDDDGDNNDDDDEADDINERY